MTKQHFEFQFQGHSIRAFDMKGKYWFVAKDIASALGYTEPAAAASKLICRNIDEFKGVQDKTVLNTQGGEQEVTILNEFGMWSFCMLAKTPIATEFRIFARELITEWRKSVMEVEPVEDKGVTSLVTPQEVVGNHQQNPNQSLTLESIEDVLIATLQQFKELRKKHEALSEYVMGLENRERKTLLLLPGQKAAIKKAVSERMRWLTINGYHTTFQKLYIALNRRFEVSSYQEIPSDRLDDAIAFVKAWRPPGTPVQVQETLFVE